jgi:hypothetical protein
MPAPPGANFCNPIKTDESRFIHLVAGCLNLRELELSSVSQMIASNFRDHGDVHNHPCRKGWIVCDGQTKLIRFNRKSVALRTAHDAEELLRTNELAVHKTAKPIPTGKVGIAR